MTLTLERKGQRDKTPTFVDRQTGVAVGSITPPISEDYWAYRVKLGDAMIQPDGSIRQQAIVGFPKFGTIGIGFAVEEDWNSNLPYTTRAEKILDHIGHNKGDDSISDSDVLEAIILVQQAATEDRGGER